MKQFRFIESKGLLIHSDFQQILKSQGLDDFQNLYGYRGGETFKENRFRSVNRICLNGADGRPQVFHLKKHHPPFVDRLKALFTGFSIGEGAENEWDKILKLHAIGIETMVPVAFGAMRKWGLPYRALTLTEHLYGAEKLETYLPTHFEQGLGDPKLIWHKRAIIRAVAGLARKLHAAGFHHQDFYLGHILIAPRPEGRFILYLIDLQRLKAPKTLRTSRIVKDLAQVYFSAAETDCFTRTDRLRFMKTYLEKERLTEADLALVRKIEDKSGRIAKHHAKVLARRARLRVDTPPSPEKDSRSKIKSRL